MRVRGSEFYLLCGCNGWGAAPQNREAIFDDGIAVPSFAWQRSRRCPPAQAKMIKTAVLQNCCFLLCSELYEMSCKVNYNSYGNSKNDYFYNQVNRYIIVYAVT